MARSYFACMKSKWLVLLGFHIKLILIHLIFFNKGKKFTPIYQLVVTVCRTNGKRGTGLIRVTLSMLQKIGTTTDTPTLLKCRLLTAKYAYFSTSYSFHYPFSPQVSLIDKITNLFVKILIFYTLSHKYLPWDRGSAMI